MLPLMAADSSCSLPEQPATLSPMAAKPRLRRKRRRDGSIFRFIIRLSGVFLFLLHIWRLRTMISCRQCLRGNDTRMHRSLCSGFHLQSVACVPVRSLQGVWRVPGSGGRSYRRFARMPPIYIARRRLSPCLSLWKIFQPCRWAVLRRPGRCRRRPYIRGDRSHR